MKKCILYDSDNSIGNEDVVGTDNTSTRSIIHLVFADRRFSTHTERPSPATSIAYTLHDLHDELERSLCQDNSNIDIMRCGANYTPQIRDELAGDIKSIACQQQQRSHQPYFDFMHNSAYAVLVYSRHALSVAF